MRHPITKIVVVSLAAILILAALAVVAFPRTLDKQYFAPQYTCACGHTMVMEFTGGNVRLYNLGHQIYYEAGTYASDGDKIIWHLPMYHTDLLLVPGRFTLVATDLSTGNHVTLKRSLRPFGIGALVDVSGFSLDKNPIEKYIRPTNHLFDKNAGT
jgi:hypothetical protein